MDYANLLPRTPVQLRQAGPADADQIAGWVRAGRAEGWFLDGDPVDGASFTRYRQSMAVDGWNYECVLVEQEGRRVGYLDYRCRRRVGEILGIFLEGSARGDRLGRHLLRWAVAAFRQIGCGEARIEIFSDNQPSLRAARGAGFELARTNHHVERGRQVHRLARRIAAWRDLTVHRSDCYGSLQGENLYLEHAAVADALAEQFSRVPGVEMVLGLGSLWRGFGDVWSDIDLAVLGRGQPMSRIWRGERWLGDYDIDIFQVDLDAAPPAAWDLARRQAFEESVVLFARAPHLPAKLARDIKLRDRERRERIAELLLKLGWIGFAPAAWYERVHLGYFWSLPPDVWLRRGSPSAAHVTVDQAIDLFLQLLFLANRAHVPDPKWRRFLAPTLSWKPRGLARRLAVTDIARRDAAGFAMRAKTVVSLVGQLVEQLAARGDLPLDLYATYLRFGKDYDPRT